jgi:broad specificity phosphatase PhoE
LIRAYILRHGATDMGPVPEGWKPISLNREGWQEVQAGADFLSQFIRDGGPKPDWGISSDLPRAEQSLAIAADFLQIPIAKPLFNLRAYEEHSETPAQFESRLLAGMSAVLEMAAKTNTVVLIIAHRSTTGFLGTHYKAWVRKPDYRYDELLLEGGVMAITDCGIEPLFRFVEKNWPEHMKCQH